MVRELGRSVPKIYAILHHGKSCPEDKVNGTNLINLDKGGIVFSLFITSSPEKGTMLIFTLKFLRAYRS